MGRQARRKHERPAPPTPPAPAPERDLARFALLVAVVAVIPYLNALGNGFVLDDELIEKDPRMRAVSLGTIFTTGYWNATSPAQTDVYRPLTVLSFALNHAVTGPNPLAFHAVNILLHAAASVLILAFLMSLLDDRTVSLVAALLYAAHPLHTEAVTSVVGRAEVQATLLLLLALYLHGRRYRLPGLHPRAALVLAVVCFALALLSKETVLVGPALVLLVGATDRREAGMPGLRRAAPVAALYGVVLVAYLWARTAVLGTTTIREQTVPGLLHGEPLPVRLLTGLDILRRYLQLLAWPVTLSADYSYNQIPISRTLAAGPLAGLACALGLAGVFAWAGRRHVHALVFALGVFALTYAVIGNLLVPIGVLLAERLMYLPSLGFCVALAWAGVTAARLRATRAMAAALAVVLLLYGARTWRRNHDWRDRETLGAATARAAPDSATARYRYGAELLLRPEKLAEAHAQLARAFEIRPSHLGAAVNLAIADLRLGDPQHALAVARTGLTYHPTNEWLRRLVGEAEEGLARRAETARGAKPP